MVKEKETTQMSFLRGVWFYFEDNGNTIALNGSFFSGKEAVYVNDELVSKKRSLGLSSKHSFAIGQENYVVLIEVANIFGALVCTLFKNDKEIDSTRFGFTLGEITLNPKKSLAFYKFLGFLLLCALIGGVVGYEAGQLAASLAIEKSHGG